MKDPGAFPLAGSPVAISTAGLIVVTADLAVIRFLALPLSVQYGVRGALAGVALLAMILSRRGMPSDYGLSITGWRGDLALIFRMGWIVLGVYVVLAAGFVASYRLGWIQTDPRHFRDFVTQEEFLDYVWSALLCAPVVEELVYRCFAVPALAAGFGRRGAFWLSGPIFYLLHLAYDADKVLMFHYVVAGWILAWAYLRTGRLWVPIVLHSLGNVLMGLDDALFLWAPRVMEWMLGKS